MELSGDWIRREGCYSRSWRPVAEWMGDIQVTGMAVGFHQVLCLLHSTTFSLSFFLFLFLSLSLGLVSVFCSNCAGDKSGSHYRVDKPQDVLLQSLFLAFQPSHSQANTLSLFGKVQNCSCRRGAFFLLCIFLISSSDLKSPPCLFFF